MLDRQEEQTVFRLAGNDGGLAAVASFLPSRLRVEIEITLELFRLGTVAGVTMLDEHWTHFLLKEGDACRISGERG